MVVKRILVVEDDSLTMMVEQEYLQSVGFVVDTATSSDEAIKKIQEHDYVLMICDVLMSEMDGFEFLKEMKRRFAHKQIPVLLVTSLDGAMTKIIEAGVSAVAILKKPFTKQSLLTAVKMLAGEPSRRTSITSVHPLSSGADTTARQVPYWDPRKRCSSLPAPPDTKQVRSVLPKPRPSKLPPIHRPEEEKKDAGPAKKKRSWLKKLGFGSKE